MVLLRVDTYFMDNIEGTMNKSREYRQRILKRIEKVSNYGYNGDNRLVDNGGAGSGNFGHGGRPGKIGGSSKYLDSESLEADRKSGYVQFHHTTDLSRVASILSSGIHPKRAREIESGDTDEPTAVFISRSDKHVAYGPNARVKDPVMIRGKIPIDYIKEHGIEDSDYHHSDLHFTKIKGQESPGWESTYYYKGTKREPHGSYGAAGLLKDIDPKWIESIKYEGKWHTPDQFMKKYGEKVDKQEKQAKLVEFFYHADNDVFRNNHHSNRFTKLYPEVKHLLKDDQKEAYELMYEMLSRRSK